MVRVGIQTLRRAPVPPDPITGIDFLSNGEASNDIRFALTGGDLLPAYPATYIWRCNLRQQNSFYTIFFWGPDGAFTGAGYYGFCPYPDGGGGGSTHKYEISANGADYTTGSPAVTYDAWRTMAGRVSNSGTNLTFRFYYNLPNTSDYIETLINSYGAGFPPSGPGLTFGGAPWNTGNECLSGILRGIQVYDAALSEANILAAAALDYDADVLALGLNPWYLNMNPTPTDITDKSGNGNDPAWKTANRPTLYTA